MKLHKTSISSGSPASDDENLLLPFERDEIPDPENRELPATTGPREVIEQAARDIKQGLRDTDQHGIPSDVPGPGLDPEETTGADVPWTEEDTNKQDNGSNKKTP